MAANSTSPATPPDTTSAAIADLVAHIGLVHRGRENDILAALVIHSLAHFLAEPSGADSLAAALNRRLAQLPGEKVWQIGQIPRAALDQLQAAIADRTWH